MTSLGERLERLAAEGRLVGFERPQPPVQTPAAPAVAAPSAAPPIDPGDLFNFGPLPGAIVATNTRLAAIEARQRLAAEGWDEAGLALVDTVARERGVDLATAAALVERENPPPDPVASGGAWHGMHSQPAAGEVGLDALMMVNDEGEAFLRQAIPAALNDVRNRR